MFVSLGFFFPLCNEAHTTIPSTLSACWPWSLLAALLFLWALLGGFAAQTFMRSVRATTFSPSSGRVRFPLTGARITREKGVEGDRAGLGEREGGRGWLLLCVQGVMEI